MYFNHLHYFITPVNRKDVLSVAAELERRRFIECVQNMHKRLEKHFTPSSTEVEVKGQ